MRGGTRTSTRPRRRERRRADADVAMSDALADADTFAAVRARRPSAGSTRVVARSLAVLEQVYMPHQVDAGPAAPHHRGAVVIESRFAAPPWRHRRRAVDDNAILAVLRTSDDTANGGPRGRHRRRVGAEVARRRARAGPSPQRRGTPPRATATTSRWRWQRPSTTRSGCSQRSTRSTRSRASRSRDEGRARRRPRARFGVARDELRPWHYDDPFFQEAPARHRGRPRPVSRATGDLDELTVRTFDGMGLDVRGVLGRSDLVPREPEGPARVLHRHRPRRRHPRARATTCPARRWAETMLHEFGHAVYFDGVEPRAPVVAAHHAPVPHRRRRDALRPARCTNRSGCERIAGVPGTTVDELAPRLQAARRAALLIFARWVLVMTHFERGLYANPDGRTTRTGGISSSASSCCAGPTVAARPTGPPRSTSPSRPSTTTTTCSVSWSRRSSTRVGSLVNNARGRARARGACCSRPAQRCGGTTSSNTATGSPLTPAAFARDLAPDDARDVRHAVRSSRRRNVVRQELRPSSRRGPSRRVARAPAAGGELHTQYLTIPDADARRVRRLAADVAVGLRARRQRARRHGRQREDLHGRRPRDRCHRRCSAWTSCGSCSSGRARPTTRSTVHVAGRELRPRRLGRTRHRRALLLVVPLRRCRAAVGSSRRAIARGCARPSAPAPRSRTA